jgi:hypothetical protein
MHSLFELCVFCTLCRECGRDVDAGCILIKNGLQRKMEMMVMHASCDHLLLPSFLTIVV